MTTLTAHIVVEFGASEDAGLVVEVDDRPAGFNLGKTSFLPGQDAYLLLFIPTGYTLVTSVITAGNLGYVQNTTKSVEQRIEFPNTDEGSLQYPYTANFTYQWVGNPPAGGSTLTPVSQTKIVLPTRPRDPSTGDPIPKYQAGIADVTYDADCQVWKIWGVPTSVDQVMAFFVVSN